MMEGQCSHHCSYGIVARVCTGRQQARGKRRHRSLRQVLRDLEEGGSVARDDPHTQESQLVEDLGQLPCRSPPPHDTAS